VTPREPTPAPQPSPPSAVPAAPHPARGADLRRATSLLTAAQRPAVDSDARLSAVLALLDEAGTLRAPDVATAAEEAGCSRTTLWRLFRRHLGCSYSEFVRRWRTLAGDAIYRRGTSDLTQTAVARLVGLGSRARLRSAFLAFFRVLPTGRAPRPGVLDRAA